MRLLTHTIMTITIATNASDPTTIPAMAPGDSGAEVVVLVATVVVVAALVVVGRAAQSMPKISNTIHDRTHLRIASNKYTYR